MVREIGLRLAGVVISEFDNAQQMGRAAAHGEARLVILSDTLPLEDSIYVARRAKDASDDMRIAYLLAMQHAETGLRALKDIHIDRYFLSPVDTEELLRQLGKLAGVEVLAFQASHSEHIAAAIFEAWERAKPGVFEKIDKLDDAAIALLDNTMTAELKSAAEGYAHNIAEVAARFGFDNGARVARELGDRFAAPALSPVDGVPISQELLTLRESLVGQPKLPAPKPTDAAATATPAGAASAFEAAQLEGRRVLVVDDEPMMSRGLTSLLGRRGLAVTALNDPLRFWSVIEEVKPNLILLDLEMPKLSGTELCRAIRNDRRWSALPVIFLTGHTDQASVQRIFAAGADDYVGKPFRLAELLARVRALLRRRAPEVIDIGGVRMETGARRVSVDGEEIALANKEFELLRVLMSRAGQVVTREEILAEVWNDPGMKTSKTLDMHMSWLRRKIGGDHRIATVRGVGFRFNHD
jgi:DNA-binding response OmpR family regulator